MMTATLTNPTRRMVLGGITALAATTAAAPVWALNDSQAKSLVGNLVADVNKVIGSGKSEAAMIRDFEKIFDRYGNVPFIARSALGPKSRELSKSELNTYVDAFSGYMSTKYGKRFREFIGGKIEVKGARASGKFFEVDTTAFLRGEDPFALTFVIAERSGQRRFVNMYIEGVNVLASERVEINALLDRNGGSVSKLISELKRLS